MRHTVKNIHCKPPVGAGLPVSLQQKAESPGVSGARKDLGHLDGSMWKALSLPLMWVFQPMHPRAMVLEGLINHIGDMHLNQEGRRCGGHPAETTSCHSSVHGSEMTSHGPSLTSSSHESLGSTLHSATKSEGVWDPMGTRPQCLESPG